MEIHCMILVRKSLIASFYQVFFKLKHVNQKYAYTFCLIKIFYGFDDDAVAKQPSLKAS